MPLPKPHAGESREDFVGRCMKDPATQDIKGDSADKSREMQLAACYRQFEAKAGDEEGSVEAKGFGTAPTLGEVEGSGRGIVEAVVATLGVVDRDADVIPPDAFPSGVKVKLSDYDHSSIASLMYGTGIPDRAPVGKGAIFVEEGKAIFRGNYFMDTVAGREAFLTAKAMGAEQEWSFGYRKLKIDRPSEDLAAKGARRILSKLGPLEASPVLYAGGVGTRTLSTKSGKTASVDGTEHPASDFAYVPDPDMPSTWKFPIFDAAHVRNALAQAHESNIPGADLAAVIARIHEAATKFGIDVAGEKKSADAIKDVDHKMGLIGESLRRR